MKTKKRFCVSICICAVVLSAMTLLSACTQYSSEQDEQKGYLQHLSWIRFDKQNDVFYKLGGLFEDVIEGRVSLAQVDSFCTGVNIFAQNDITDGIYDLLHQTEISGVQETLQELMTASSKITSERIKRLDNEKLELLAAICYDLGDCCDRGKTNQSLAFYLSEQDLSSEAFYQSLQKTNTLLDKLDELI